MSRTAEVSVDRNLEKVRKGVQYALDIVDLCKGFHRRTVKRGGYTTVKSTLLNFFRGGRDSVGQITTVLESLTLRIPQGSSVGIIGRNGAGKSTLLKLISGIYRPDSGSIKVNGRIAALIELGAGFHPDFSGRENLYLGGIMHGLSEKEIDQRFDDIVRFAELEDVIDDPVRTYSSGMYMRLGFSLAVHTDPDILIVDEVLAVGDAKFVSKCKERIAEFRAAGKTLLLVTHDLSSVERWCDEVLWIERGRVRDRGSPRRVIDHYLQYIENEEERELDQSKIGEIRSVSDQKIDSSKGERHEFEGPSDIAAQRMVPERWGSREIEVVKVILCDASGNPHSLYHPDGAFNILIEYKINEAVTDIVFGIGINRSDGLNVFGSNTLIDRFEFPELRKAGTIKVQVNRIGLLTGNYSLDVAIHRQDGYPYDYHQSAATFAVRSPLKQVGVVAPDYSWDVVA